jgi:hypothetical protein
MMRYTKIRNWWRELASEKAPSAGLVRCLPDNKIPYQPEPYNAMQGEKNATSPILEQAIQFRELIYL